MISVFSPKISPRLIYVLDFCFKAKEIEYQVIQSEEEWDTVEGIRINYSRKNVDCNYSIEPCGLLFETGVEQNLKLELLDDELQIRSFQDELSSIFYLLSRYEEHQNYQADQHGRFTSDQSQQKQMGLLETPIVDELVKRIWDKSGLDYSPILEQFQCVPSFDIDVAWAYKGRPLWRTMAGIINGSVTERISVLLKRKKDPYDTYSEIIQVSTELERVICFTLLSDWGKYDKNINWKNPEFQSLIRGLNAAGGMGIHPGYSSHLKPEIVAKETKRLEEIVGHEIEKSRFHFLRFELPKSYQLLVKNGIKKDYSMGYADDIGFRAGTSIPFYYYNLETEKQEDLLIFPFVYMDSALKDYLKLSPEYAIEKIEVLMGKTAAVGGLFMCVWHNSSITDLGQWKGWREVLRHTVKFSKSLA